MPQPVARSSTGRRSGLHDAAATFPPRVAVNRTGAPHGPLTRPPRRPGPQVRIRRCGRTMFRTQPAFSCGLVWRRPNGGCADRRRCGGPVTQNSTESNTPAPSLGQQARVRTVGFSFAIDTRFPGPSAPRTVDRAPKRRPIPMCPDRTGGTSPIPGAGPAAPRRRRTTIRSRSAVGAPDCTDGGKKARTQGPGAVIVCAGINLPNTEPAT